MTDIERLQERMRSGLSMPLIDPAYNDSPSRCRATTYIARYRIDEEVYRAIIPDPLTPMEKPRCQVWLNRIHEASMYGPYNELIVNLGVRYQGDIMVYTPLLYVDQFTAIAQAREIWGAPKVSVDEVEFLRNEREVICILSSGNTELFSISIKEDEYISDVEEMPLSDETKIVNLKRIPSAEQGEPPSVNRLTVATLTDIETGFSTRGPATVNIPKQHNNALCLFTPQSPPEGFRIDLEWTYGYADSGILHVYNEYDPAE